MKDRPPRLALKYERYYIVAVVLVAAVLIVIGSLV